MPYRIPEEGSSWLYWKGLNWKDKIKELPFLIRRQVSIWYIKGGEKAYKKDYDEHGDLYPPILISHSLAHILLGMVLGLVLNPYYVFFLILGVELGEKEGPVLKRAIDVATWTLGAVII